MGQTANKLSTALRDAMVGGTYDASKLRVRIVMQDGVTTENLSDDRRINSDIELTGHLYGIHPEEDGDWEIPLLSFSVINADRRFTPGAAGGLFPSAKASGWTIEVHLEEKLTSDTWVEYWGQDFVLGGVTLKQSVATFVCGHDAHAYITFKWDRETHQHAVDWNSQPHTR